MKATFLPFRMRGTGSRKYGRTILKLRKITFLNEIVDSSYATLHDILIENDNKTCTECILALRKKAVATEENKKGHRPLRRIVANVRPDSQEQDAQL